jgi:hypothetical protein
MNSNWLPPMIAMVALLAGATQVLLRAREARDHAREAAIHAVDQAQAARQRAELAAGRVALGLAADRQRAAILAVWQEHRRDADALAAEAVRLAGAAGLLVTGQQRQSAPITTPAGIVPAEWIDLDATGPAAALMNWIGQLEAGLEPAAIRALRLRPGVHQVDLHLTLALPTDLP